MLQTTTKSIKYGLKYNGRLYGWMNKKLYSLPYFNPKTKRSYEMKEVKQINNHFILARNKVHLNTLKNKTKIINYQFEINITDCPF